MRYQPLVLQTWSWAFENSKKDQCKDQGCQKLPKTQQNSIVQGSVLKDYSTSLIPYTNQTKQHIPTCHLAICTHREVLLCWLFTHQSYYQYTSYQQQRNHTRLIQRPIIFNTIIYQSKIRMILWIRNTTTSSKSEKNGCLQFIAH